MAATVVLLLSKLDKGETASPVGHVGVKCILPKSLLFRNSWEEGKEQVLAVYFEIYFKYVMVEELLILSLFTLRKYISSVN